MKLKVLQPDEIAMETTGDLILGGMYSVLEGKMV